MHTFIHSFIHRFIHSFIHPSIHPSIQRDGCTLITRFYYRCHTLTRAHSGSQRSAADVQRACKVVEGVQGLCGGVADQEPDDTCNIGAAAELPVHQECVPERSVTRTRHRPRHPVSLLPPPAYPDTATDKRTHKNTSGRPSTSPLAHSHPVTALRPHNKADLTVRNLRCCTAAGGEHRPPHSHDPEIQERATEQRHLLRAGRFVVVIGGGRR